MSCKSKAIETCENQHENKKKDLELVSRPLFLLNFSSEYCSFVIMHKQTKFHY